MLPFPDALFVKLYRAQLHFHVVVDVSIDVIIAECLIDQFFSE